MQSKTQLQWTRKLIQADIHVKVVFIPAKSLIVLQI